ncbi:MAG: hypothetical protein ABWY03_02460 [Microbacterium sp.]
MAAKKPVLAFGGAASVNLLPAVETQRRERLELTRKWAAAAIGSVAVTLVIIVIAFGVNWLATQNLAAQQARTNELLAERAAFAEVSQAITTTQGIEAFRADAMARDFAWAPLYDDVASRLPEGVTIVESSMVPRADPALAAGVPVESVGASGTISFTAASPSAQALTVEALRDLPGLISVDAGALFAQGESGVEFVVALVYDTTIFSGAYALEGAEN